MKNITLKYLNELADDFLLNASYVAKCEKWNPSKPNAKFSIFSMTYEPNGAPRIFCALHEQQFNTKRDVYEYIMYEKEVNEKRQTIINAIRKAIKAKENETGLHLNKYGMYEAVWSTYDVIDYIDLHKNDKLITKVNSIFERIENGEMDDYLEQ